MNEWWRRKLVDHLQNLFLYDALWLIWCVLVVIVQMGIAVNALFVQCTWSFWNDSVSTQRT